MLKNKPIISFINHDIKNHIGNSITILQLLELENPHLVGSENIEIVTKGVYRAVELSNDVAYNVGNNTENI